MMKKRQESIPFILVMVAILWTILTSTQAVFASDTTLKVNILPKEAAEDGARWRYTIRGSVNWSPWYESGWVAEADTGIYKVEFKDTTSDNWLTPPMTEVTIVNGQHLVINKTYQPSATEASVKVEFNVDGIQADARWYLYYFDSGQKKYLAVDKVSGTKISIKPTNNPYFLEFSYVSNLARPETMQLNLNVGDSVQVQKDYKDLIVGNIHIYGNRLEYSDTGFNTKGSTRWKFRYVWGNQSVTESVFYVKAIPDLHGSFNPPRICGNGALEMIVDQQSGWSTFLSMLNRDNTFFRGQFILDADTLKAIETSNAHYVWDWMQMRYKITDFSLIKSPVFGLVQSGRGELDWEIFDEPSKVIFKKVKVFENENKPQITGKVIWKGGTVSNWVTFHQTEINLDTTTKTFTAEGFDVEVLQDLPSFRGSIRVEDGKLTQLSAELYDIGLGFDDCPVVFDNCGIAFKNPAKKSATVDINAGVKFVLPKIDKEVGSDTWEGHLDLGGHLSVKGNRKLFGYDIGRHETEVQWSGDHQYFSSSFDALTYIGGYLQFLINGQGALYIQWKPVFDFSGWIEASGFIPLPEWLSWLSKSGQIHVGSFLVSIDSEGFILSADVLGLFNISIEIPPLWELNKSGTAGDDVENRQRLNQQLQFKQMQSGAVGDFVINGEPGFILSIQGSGGAPDVVLVMPDGREIKSNQTTGMQDIGIGIDHQHGCTGFIVKNPQPGTWRVQVPDPSHCTQRLIRGNRPPQIIPLGMEKLENGSYRLTYEAYDADNRAKIRFYCSADRKTFLGEPIAVAAEADGPGTIVWTAGGAQFRGRYICAVIDDGINQTSRAYFPGHIVYGQAPPAPQLADIQMQGDSMVLSFDGLDTDNIDSLRIYYCDDLEAETFGQYVTTLPSTPVVLKETEIIPGRKYRICVTAYNHLSGESDFSTHKIVDYRLSSGNNYPAIISQPELEAYTGSTYHYQVTANDYDGDSLVYTITEGPDTMTIDSNGRITWKPEHESYGRHMVQVAVDDGKGGSDTQKFWLDVRLGIDIDKPKGWRLTHAAGRDGNRLIVELKDIRFNHKSALSEQISVTIVDEIIGSSWDLVMHETADNSGHFRGVINFSDGDSYHILNSEYHLTIRYQDQKNRRITFRPARVFR